MKDRELLELASKAIGQVYVDGESWDEGAGWNPLNDDGDALRLAVKLGVELVFTKNKIGAGRRNLSTYPWVNEDRNVDDRYSATRRAIVRAAAEIGRNMK